jgi:hypothetical protein
MLWYTSWLRVATSVCLISRLFSHGPIVGHIKTQFDSACHSTHTTGVSSMQPCWRSTSCCLQQPHHGQLSFTW